MFQFKAPKAVQVTPRTTTSVTVTMNATDKGTDVSYYEASQSREFCTVSASVSPLSCNLENLQPGTRYRVGAVACMADDSCSYRAFAIGYTLPDGKLLKD